MQMSRSVMTGYKYESFAFALTLTYDYLRVGDRADGRIQK